MARHLPPQPSTARSRRRPRSRRGGRPHPALRGADRRCSTATRRRQATADPVLERLFPRAYLDPTEEEAEAEWQRLVHDDLVDGRRQALATVERTLAGAMVRRGRFELTLNEEQAQAWLAVINDARLALGTRLEVTEDIDLSRARSRRSGHRALRRLLVARRPRGTPDRRLLYAVKSDPAGTARRGAEVSARMAPIGSPTSGLDLGAPRQGPDGGSGRRPRRPWPVARSWPAARQRERRAGAARPILRFGSTRPAEGDAQAPPGPTAPDGTGATAGPRNGSGAAPTKGAPGTTGSGPGATQAGGRHVHQRSLRPRAEVDHPDDRRVDDAHRAPGAGRRGDPVVPGDRPPGWNPLPKAPIGGPGRPRRRLDRPGDGDLGRHQRLRGGPVHRRSRLRPRHPHLAEGSRRAALAPLRRPGVLDRPGDDRLRRHLGRGRSSWRRCGLGSGHQPLAGPPRLAARAPRRRRRGLGRRPPRDVGRLHRRCPDDAPDDAADRGEERRRGLRSRHQQLGPGPGRRPDPARSGADSVWTGSRLVVTGGYHEGDDDDRTDGAAFDPVSGAWSPIAARPHARLLRRRQPPARGSGPARWRCSPSPAWPTTPPPTAGRPWPPPRSPDGPAPGEPAVWTGQPAR